MRRRFGSHGGNGASTVFDDDDKYGKSSGAGNIFMKSLKSPLSQILLGACALSTIMLVWNRSYMTPLWTDFQKLQTSITDITAAKKEIEESTQTAQAELDKLTKEHNELGEKQDLEHGKERRELEKAIEALITEKDDTDDQIKKVQEEIEEQKKPKDESSPKEGQSSADDKPKAEGGKNSGDSAQNSSTEKKTEGASKEEYEALDSELEKRVSQMEKKVSKIKDFVKANNDQNKGEMSDVIDDIELVMTQLKDTTSKMKALHSKD